MWGGWGGVQKVGEVEGAYVRVVIGSMIRGVRERIKILNGVIGPTLVKSVCSACD